jgi:hypothetical protein
VVACGSKWYFEWLQVVVIDCKSLATSLLVGKTGSQHIFFVVLITYIAVGVGPSSTGHGENDWSVEIA